MSRSLARLALGSYRLFGRTAYPLVGAYLSYRAARGKEEPDRRRERYGYASAPREPGPLVWIHAASVGETNAVVPLIGEIRRRGVAVVLTTGTVTSAAIVRQRLDGVVTHQYVPLDIQPAVSRFLDHWKPDLAIIAESEIWPITILELGRRRIPQVLVNGRMSDRSFRSWSRRPNVAEALFENISHVVAQSDLDAERFRDLGATAVSVAGNLKVDVPAPVCRQSDLAVLKDQIGDRRVWAAISTFEGEESAAAVVHREIAAGRDALTVVVPRHPERADAIERMLKAKGLSVARRSRGDGVERGTDIFLGDTMGEMGLYLSLAEIVFVGRSLTEKGGQNPLEPAMMGCAILSGSNVQNFREAYQQLVRSGGARIVRDEATLVRGVDYLMAHEAERLKMVAAATQTVESMRGALARTVAALEPYLQPLSFKARLAAGGIPARTG